MIGFYTVNGRNASYTPEAYVLVFVLSGATSLGDKALAAGQGILCGAEALDGKAGLPREYLRVDFSEREILRALSERGIRVGGAPFHFAVGEELRRTAEFFFGRSAPIEHGLRKLAIAELLLSYVEGVTEDEAEDTAASGYVRFTEEYIRDNLGKSFQVDAIAEELGISRGYLRNVFFAVHGVSPREYLTEARLRKAEVLLRESGLSVTAVAEAVGYEDVLQFSRIFKKHTGMSPSEFRGGKRIRVASPRVEKETSTERIEPTFAVETTKKKEKDPVWLF